MRKIMNEQEIAENSYKFKIALSTDDYKEARKLCNEAYESSFNLYLELIDRKRESISSRISPGKSPNFNKAIKKTVSDLENYLKIELRLASLKPGETQK